MDILEKNPKSFCFPLCFDGCLVYLVDASAFWTVICGVTLMYLHVRMHVGVSS